MTDRGKGGDGGGREKTVTREERTWEEGKEGRRERVMGKEERVEEGKA